MINAVLSELKEAEFWAGVAFFVMVVVSLRPLHRWLVRWGKKQADAVEKSLSDAAEVREKAEALLKKYQKMTRNRESERTRLLAEADSETTFFEKEMKERLADRIAHKKQETALRLKMIEENGKQDIKNKLLKRVVDLTKRNLSDKQNAGELQEDMSCVLQRVSEALDENKDMLEKA